MALDPQIRINLDRSVVLLIEHNPQALEALNAMFRGFGARRVQYWPTTGRAQQRTVTDNAELTRLSEPARQRPAPVEDEGSVELF